MTYKRLMIVSAVIVLSAIAIATGRDCWVRRAWFDIQAQQLAAIKRLEAYPPPAWEQRAWNNALVTPYNVWGNVTFSPQCSGISNAEMRDLQRELDQIVAETNGGNSIQSVDRVFLLLLRRGKQAEFISVYREEFRTYDSTVKRKAIGATAAP